ncbi:hypothetical protein ANRL4_04528 [Anaerolineae bacterium]|nr:hypothetical protein ANRL4_04528 [Anaerolineae bacterium]
MGQITMRKIIEPPVKVVAVQFVISFEGGSTIITRIGD